MRTVVCAAYALLLGLVHSASELILGHPGNDGFALVVGCSLALNIAMVGLFGYSALLISWKEARTREVHGKEIRRLEKCAKRIFEAIPEGAVLSSDSKIMMCNPGLTKLLDELSRKGITAGIADLGNEEEKLLAGIRVTAATDRDDNNESYPLAKRVSEDSVGTRNYKVIGPAEQPATLTLSKHRISSRRHLDLCLIALAPLDPAALERCNRNWLSVVVHELRNLLGGVLGAFDILSGTPTPDELREYCSIGSNSAHMMLAFINDILDMSQLKNGSFKMTPESVDVAVAVREVMQFMEPMYAKKGVRLSCSELDGVLTSIGCDRTRYKQILFNLLGNALKFTSFGSVSIRLEYDPIQNLLVTRVTDTGKGIDRASLDKLFCMYGKLCTDAKTNPQGTGLGLFICKSLSEGMGGHISVDSQLGKGSTFTFSVKDQELAGEKKEQSEDEIKDFGMARQHGKTTTEERKRDPTTPKRPLIVFKPPIQFQQRSLFKEAASDELNLELSPTICARARSRRCTDSASKLVLDTTKHMDTCDTVPTVNASWKRVFSAVFPKPAGDTMTNSNDCGCAQILAVDDDYFSLCILKKQLLVLGYKTDIVL